MAISVMGDAATGTNGTVTNGATSIGAVENGSITKGIRANGTSLDTTISNASPGDAHKIDASKWSPSPLETLSSDLETNVRVLSNYLRCSNHEQPSFARDSLATNVPSDAPQDVHIAKDKIMESALQIFQMAAGPSMYIENVILGYHNMANFRWLSHFGIFEIVPLHGSISYAEVARRANVTEARLKSIVRLAMTNHLFDEPTPGQLAHSATSAAMVTNVNWCDQRLWVTKVITPTIANTVEAHEKWPTSTAANETPFNHALKTDLPLYKYAAQDPEMYQLFGRVMKALAAHPRSDIKHLVNSFDWANLGKATVVDIGGNIGHGCVVLAKSFPTLSFVCQDTAQVVQQGSTHVQMTESSAIASRVLFQEYDFFTPQPVTDADVYLLRQILHNWDFDNCVKILSQVVPAMKPGAHIAIADLVLPDPGSVPAVLERVIRSRDVGMMQLFNSKERNMEEWGEIIQKADPRLKIKGVGQPWGSSLAVIDVVLEG